MAEAGTLPSLLLRNAAERGDRPAMREKDRGIWQTYSWRRVRDEVRDLALGLAALGFRRGDKLSVIGDNRPRLYWAQLAAQALGGASVPVYQDSIARELAYVWSHADVSVIVPPTKVCVRGKAPVGESDVGSPRQLVVPPICS